MADDADAGSGSTPDDGTVASSTDGEPNYWETELAARGQPLKYIQYMRGDKIKADEFREHAIDHYLATYYEDIEELYTDGVYRLGLTRV